jgi:hypothetical protein
LEDSNHPRFNDLKIQKDFAINMATLLSLGQSFIWKENLEFLIIPEKVS